MPSNYRTEDPADVLAVGQWAPLADAARRVPCGAGLYIVRHRASGKEYVGLSKNVYTRLDSHRRAASGSFLHRAIRCYGVDAFEACLYIQAEPDDLGELERMLIEERNTAAPNGYNLTLGGDGLWGYTPSTETRQKLRMALLGREVSESVRLAVAESNRRRGQTPEARAKIAAYGRTRTASPETRAKMSRSQMGHAITEETKRKIAATKIGIPLSEEHRRKMSEALKGRIISEEHCRNLSAALKGKPRSAEARAAYCLAKQRQLRDDPATFSHLNGGGARPVVVTELDGQELEFTSGKAASIHYGLGRHYVPVSIRIGRKLPGGQSVRWK